METYKPAKLQENKDLIQDWYFKSHWPETENHNPAANPHFRGT